MHLVRGLLKEYQYTTLSPVIIGICGVALVGPRVCCFGLIVLIIVLIKQGVTGGI